MLSGAPTIPSFRLTHSSIFEKRILIFYLLSVNCHLRKAFWRSFDWALAPCHDNYHDHFPSLQLMHTKTQQSVPTFEPVMCNSPQLAIYNAQLIWLTNQDKSAETGHFTSRQRKGIPGMNPETESLSSKTHTQSDTWGFHKSWTHYITSITGRLNHKASLDSIRSLPVTGWSELWQPLQMWELHEPTSRRSSRSAARFYQAFWFKVTPPPPLVLDSPLSRHGCLFRPVFLQDPQTRQTIWENSLLYVQNPSKDSVDFVV